MEEGRCPKCGNTDLDYGASELECNQIFYPFSCKYCKFEGKEWYILKFNGFTDVLNVIIQI